MRSRRIGSGAWALAAAGALAVAAGTASAGNPSPESRREAVIAAFGQVEVCQGGADEGQICTDSFECAPPGACTGTRGARVLARGTLTVIADTVLATPLPPDPFLEGAPAAPCTDCEGQDGRSSFTLLLQFARDGKRFTFAETFTDVRADSVNGFGSQIGQFIPGWSVGAFETTLANSPETHPDFGGYKIRFALLPPAAAAAVAAALGEPGKAPVLLEVEELAHCTDPVACNHCDTFDPPACRVGNDRWSKHSDPSDPLASVRQFKVGLGFIDPPAP